jgi:hypothetical protein
MPMTVRLAFVAPSRYVDELCNPGLDTSAGPVALSAYVSGRLRSPLAAAVLQQLDRQMDGGEPSSDHAGALADLRALRQQVRGGSGEVRESNWRRVFTGQGLPVNLVAVWEFVLSHRSFLESLPPLRAAADGRGRDRAPRDYTWAAWFARGHAVRAMVADGVFGHDCLGFVGTYLCRAGIESGYPERSVAQYATQAGLIPVTALDEVRPLSLLLWPGAAGDTQHIALIDRVHGFVEGEHGQRRLRVDLCQSSVGGPQCNRRVLIAAAGGEGVHSGRTTLPGYRIVEGGTPVAPVRGPFALMRHPDWLLVP